MHLRVEKTAERIWQVVATSERGMTWLKANFAEMTNADEDGFTTDLMGTNSFMGKAHGHGYRIEYIGPNRVVHFWSAFIGEVSTLSG